MVDSSFSQVRAFAVVRAPDAEDVIHEFCVLCNHSTCRDPSCKGTRSKRAWCVRGLLVADHTGAAEVGADASVVHEIYDAESIAELADATCVPYTGLWHGRFMLKARRVSGVSFRHAGGCGGSCCKPVSLGRGVRQGRG